MSSDFTKWERSSIKTNIILPIVFIVVAFVLVIVMFVVKPKPVDSTKKDAKTSGEVEEAAEVDDIDWNNF